MGASDKHAAILLVVSKIPAGRVASYGQVAELAGLPGRARMVGQILANLPARSKLPWFRVVNARGAISFAPDSESFARQRQALEAEGVEFSARCTIAARFRWTP